MSRGATSPVAQALANDVKVLQGLGGPFLVKVMRREGGNRLVYIAHWEGITLDELAGPVHKTLYDYAGGGEYQLSGYPPDDKIRPKHAFPVIVPGEPRIPTDFPSGAALGGAPLPTLPPIPSWPGWAR